MSHLKTYLRIKGFYHLKVNYVGLFEIQVLIVLPIFEHETADSLWMDMLFMFFSSKNRFVIIPET